MNWPEGWKQLQFESCVEPVRIDRARQVPASKYQPAGAIPVVDQGQSLVAGWTDEPGTAIKDRLPIIIFGDHTRVFKYIDFPFALGADGTKPFRAKEGIDPRYLYFHLLGLDIPSRGYSRHYRLLAEKPVLLPDIAEQRKIAAVLLRTQRAIEAQEKIIATLRDLKKSTMQYVFTHGLRGGHTAETEYGVLPRNWPLVLLGACCVVQTGLAKGREIEPDEVIELPYLRVANVQDGHLDLSEVKTIKLRRSEKDRFLLWHGDVLFTEGGDFDKLGRGCLWEGQVPDCVHQNHIFAVRPDPSRLLPHFLAYLAQSPYGRAYFLAVAHKTTNLACINATKLKALPVPLPEIEEQREITDILDTLDQKMKSAEAKGSALQDLFGAMLNKLMTGEIRAKDLVIDTREVNNERE